MQPAPCLLANRPADLKLSHYEKSGNTTLQCSRATTVCTVSGCDRRQRLLLFQFILESAATLNMKGKRGRVERVPEDRPLHDDDGPPPLINNTEPDPHHADPVHLSTSDDSDDGATMEGNDANAFSDGELNAPLQYFLNSAK